LAGGDFHLERKIIEALRRRPALKVLFIGLPAQRHRPPWVVDPDVQMTGKPSSLRQLAATVRAVLDAR